jgi:hypothetical protein
VKLANELILVSQVVVGLLLTRNATARIANFSDSQLGEVIMQRASYSMPIPGAHRDAVILPRDDLCNEFCRTILLFTVLVFMGFLITAFSCA